MLHEILLTIEARAGTFFHASQSMLGTPTASHAAIPYVSLHPIAVQLEFMHQAARSRDLGPGLGKAQLDKGGLFSILSLVGLRETSSRFAGRGVHCCAAAGKDALTQRRGKSNV